MNTLKEKITILEAMEKGLAIQYSETDGETDDWEDLKTSELDFELYTYRVKSQVKRKFRTGDVLVNKAEENKPNPPLFLVEEASDEGYILDKSVITDLETIESEFVLVSEVLWYFEVCDLLSKKCVFRLIRTTMSEMDKEFAARCDTFSWQPMYALGFKLKES